MYDFKQLSPHDLELLSRDLLQAEWGVRVESFKTGKDGGIDLRYADVPGKSGLVQCKHYARSGTDALVSALKKEVKKVQKLNPSRYFITTSCELSAANKAKIKRILAPFIREDQDIYGCEDLNNLLNLHGDVHRRHYKLWVGSVEILERVLNSRIFTQTELSVEAIRRRLSLFVHTPALPRVMDLLAMHGYCLISGIPGIGKTTTAEMALMLHVKEGWEPVVITEHAGEALQVRNPQSRQIYFFDDFLGQTSLEEKLSKGEDVALQTIIRTAKKSSMVRILLTTRDYILVDARKRYEKLNWLGLEAANCVVRMSDLSRMTKARILTNLLFFHDLPQETISHLVKRRVARRIIEHKNYSPRLVDWVCGSGLFPTTDPKGFSLDFMKNLTDPSRLWKSAVEDQLSDDSTSVLVVIASLGGRVQLDELKKGLASHCKFSNSEATRRASDAIAVLEGNFVRIRVERRNTSVEFHNPSIQDFMKSYIANTDHVRERLIEGMIRFEQLSFVVEIAGDSLVDETMIVKQEALFRDSVARSIGAGLHAWYIRPSQNLRQILRWAKLRGGAVKRAAIRLIDGYFSSPSAGEDVESLLQLYKKASALIREAGLTGCTLAPPDADWCWEHICSIDGFVGFWWLIEDNDEEAEDRLRKEFLEFVEDDIEQLVSHLESSDEAESYMSQVQEAVDTLGVDEPHNFHQIEERLDDLREQEELQAEEESREREERREYEGLREYEEPREGAEEAARARARTSRCGDEVDDLLDSLIS